MLAAEKGSKSSSGPQPPNSCTTCSIVGHPRKCHGPWPTTIKTCLEMEGVFMGTCSSWVFISRERWHVISLDLFFPFFQMTWVDMLQCCGSVRLSGLRAMSTMWGTTQSSSYFWQEVGSCGTTGAVKSWGSEGKRIELKSSIDTSHGRLDSRCSNDILCKYIENNSAS